LTDKELEKINAKKFRELKKKYLFKTPLQDDLSKKQEPKISPRDVLIKRLYDRGLDVLVAAETQFPQETNLIISQLIQIMDSQKIDYISGPVLLSLFRSLGIRVHLKTNISIDKKGKRMSINDAVTSKKD